MLHVGKGSDRCSVSRLSLLCRFCHCQLLARRIKAVMLRTESMVSLRNSLFMIIVAIWTNLFHEFLRSLPLVFCDWFSTVDAAIDAPYQTLIGRLVAVGSNLNTPTSFRCQYKQFCHESGFSLAYTALQLNERVCVIFAKVRVTVPQLTRHKYPRLLHPFLLSQTF